MALMSPDFHWGDRLRQTTIKLLDSRPRKYRFELVFTRLEIPEDDLQVLRLGVRAFLRACGAQVEPIVDNPSAALPLVVASAIDSQNAKGMLRGPIVIGGKVQEDVPIEVHQLEPSQVSGSDRIPGTGVQLEDLDRWDSLDQVLASCHIPTLLLCSLRLDSDG